MTFFHRAHEESLMSATPEMTTPDDIFADISFDTNRGQHVCGQGVLNKMVKKSPSRPSESSDVDGDGTRSCLTPWKNRRKYSEVGDPGRSPEDTESSSSASDAGGDELHIDHHNKLLIPQFDVEELKKIEREKSDAKKQVLEMYGFRGNAPWTTTLPVVKEEPHSFDTEEQSHHEEQESKKTPGSKGKKMSTPEKNHVLEAMRTLVLKQQAALKDLAEENSHFRGKLGDYQKMLIKMKQEESKKDGTISQLTLDKDALEAEVLWLREEIRAYRRNDDEDAEISKKLQSLMDDGRKSSLSSHSTDKAAEQAFNSFKQTLSPTLRMNSTNASTSTPTSSIFSCSPTAWQWDSREEKEEERKERPHLVETRERPQSSDSGGMRGLTDVSTENDELQIFKQRLEYIQRKRNSRQSERKQSGKQNVRFGAMMI